MFPHIKVVRKEYEVRVEGKDVALGNTAFLKCHIPDHVKHFVSVTSWYRGDEVLMPEMSDICKCFVGYFSLFCFNRKDAQLRLNVVLILQLVGIL